MNNDQLPNPDGIRLNRYLSTCGFCSRRKADEYVELGQVAIDGKIAQVGDRVHPGQVVTVNGKPVTLEEEKIYILLHKPLYITSTAEKSDPNNVIDFVGFPKRIYPVGRLDQMSTGLLLLTNDGDLTYRLLRTAGGHEKEYIVTVTTNITDEFLRGMQTGVQLPDGPMTIPCKVEKQTDRRFSVTLTQGLNRQIRRMCEVLGYTVATLKRVRIQNLRLDGLEAGKWRHLTEKERVELLRSVGL